MNASLSGYNVPEPVYGIGAVALINQWIELEAAQRAAGMRDAASQTKMMRRQLQEALDLVGDPGSDAGHSMRRLASKCECLTGRRLQS